MTLATIWAVDYFGPGDRVLGGVELDQASRCKKIKDTLTPRRKEQMDDAVRFADPSAVPQSQANVDNDQHAVRVHFRPQRASRR